MAFPGRRAGPLLAALVPVLLSAAVFWPITRNFFHLDDFEHLFMIRDGRTLEFLLAPYGGHALLLRNLVFVAMHALFGVEPRGYLVVALLTHLLNVGLLFALLRVLTGSLALACVGATAWGTAAVHDEALGWYSVYGQVLMVTLLLWVWWDLSRQGRAGAAPTRRRAAGWIIALLAASLSFGVGIGLALAFAPAGALLLRHPAQRRARSALATLVVAVPALYALTHVAYAVVMGHAHVSSGWLPAAPDVIAPVVTMTAMLLASGTAQVLFGAWLPAAPDFATLIPLGAAALVGIAAGAAVATPAQRRALAAAALLALGAYGIIALGRAPITPAAWMNWPRYHYAASLPIVVAACVALSAAAARLALPIAARRACTGAWLLLTAGALAWWPPVIADHAGERQQVERMGAAVQARLLTAPAGEPVYVANRPMLPMGYFVPRTVFPGWAGLWVIFSETRNGEAARVFFIEPSREAVAAAQQRIGSRSATLLVSPGPPVGAPTAPRK